MALAVLAAQLPEVGRHHDFGDWVSVCDNGLRCQVGSAFGQADNIDVHMHLRREAGPNSPIEVGVFSSGGWQRGPHFLVIDGRTFSLVAKLGDMIARPGSGVAVARALATARSVYVLEGRRRFSISPKGSAAALRDMDAQQRRAGTVTAVVATGSKPTSSVPGAPALPIRFEKTRPRKGLVVRPSAERLAAWRAEGCYKGLDPATEPPTSWPIDERTAVILVMCGSGGHNPGVLVKVGTKADGTDARTALFDYDASLSEQSGPAVPPENPSQDETTGRLVSGQSGGLADSSSREEWVWDGDRFRLVASSTSYGSTFRARVGRR